ncbi:hypothetical protein KDA_69210 [Dictyobacter alpinus]|uniref:Uncharacterized protein n=1 Tax=Dictyobacter alpinus TaxID=2014873 RepID=A0A402BJB9_9CHLR|nr:hypothetical protein [Dictyobacter alpinus]GCE31437.1 hypothetical protein KDA_69210 [Dictyobacter alpinus]
MSQQQEHERFYAGIDSPHTYTSDTHEPVHIADKPSIFIDFRFLVALNSIIILMIPAIISIVLSFLIFDLATIGHGGDASILLLLLPLSLAGMFASLLHGWNTRMDRKSKNTRSGKISINPPVPLAQRITLGLLSLLLAGITILQIITYTRVLESRLPFIVITIAIAVVLNWSALWIQRSFYRR